MNSAQQVDLSATSFGLLPLEIRLAILEEASCIDLPTAHAISLTCKTLARRAQENPQSSFHSVLRLTGDLSSLATLVGGLIKGRIDPTVVRAVFICNTLERAYSVSEIETLTKSLSPLLDVPILQGPDEQSIHISHRTALAMRDFVVAILRKIFEICPRQLKLHIWEPTSVGLSFEATIRPLLAYPLEYLPRPAEISIPSAAISRKPWQFLGEGLRRIHFIYPKLTSSLCRSLAADEAWRELRLTRPLASGRDVNHWLVALVNSMTSSQRQNTRIFIELGYDISVEDFEGQIAAWQDRPHLNVSFLHHSLLNTVLSHDAWTQEYSLRQCVRSVLDQESWWTASDRHVILH